MLQELVLNLACLANMEMCMSLHIEGYVCQLTLGLQDPRGALPILVPQLPQHNHTA